MTKQLVRNANKGNLLAAFELYQEVRKDMLIGKYEPAIIGDSISNEWFGICWNYIQASTEESQNYRPLNHFYLRMLSLTDYRRFGQLNIHFQEDLTIIIGNNGKGKTSILTAIARTLSWFSANIVKEDVSGQRLNEFTDIRNDSESNFADVSTSFSYGKGLKNVSVRLSRSVPGSAERRESIVKPAKELADIWRIINEEKTINLPVFAFYSVERSHSFIKPARDSNEKREDRFDAYNQALTGAGRFDHFSEWFIYLHKRFTANDSTEIKMLEIQLKSLKSLLQTGIVTIKPLLEETKKRLNKLRAQSEKNMMSEEAQIKTVSRAITEIIPSINRIWVDTSTGTDVIRVINDGFEVSIDQISDGQRVFLGLVADLARRMVMLNPTLANPLEGQGIVLIDEIELHLHPKWQQGVIPGLRKVFPNVQFIITTHSPIVLSTTDRKCIREFSEDVENNEHYLDLPPIQTKGNESSEILEQVMHVSSLPMDIDESHLISDFERSLIGTEDSLSAESKDLLDKIEKHFGVKSTAMDKANSLIRLHLMKNKIKKVKKDKEFKG